MNCSTERKNQIKNKLQHYKKKNVGEPFISGQKYYILDQNVPNCVNSFICKQSAYAGRSHTSLGQGQTFADNNCLSYDSQYNTGNGLQQLDKLTQNYNDLKVKVLNDNGKYKYALNDQPDIYYRTCPIWGCKPGTSLMELAKGGRKTRRRSRK